MRTRLIEVSYIGRGVESKGQEGAEGSEEEDRKQRKPCRPLWTSINTKAKQYLCTCVMILSKFLNHNIANNFWISKKIVHHFISI